MALQALMEVTKWEGAQLNHMYWMDGDKAYGYSKWGKEAPQYFNTPMTLDKRRRKFVAVTDHKFITPVKEANPNIVEVTGSNGTVYHVDKVNRTCDCPASKFRKGECKHIKEVCK